MCIRDSPELIEEGINGCLVPVGDAAALAKHLKHILTEPQTMKSFGENSLNKARQNFDWSRTVEQYLAVYDQLLGRVEMKTSQPPANES